MSQIASIVHRTQDKAFWYSIYYTWRFNKCKYSITDHGIPVTQKMVKHRDLSSQYTNW